MGIFSKLFTGMQGDDDTVYYQAPATRPQLFRLVLKERFWNLMPLNLTFLVFCLPAAAWCGFWLMGLEKAITDGTMNEVLAALHAMVLGLVPLITLTGPAMAGMTCVTRRWARDEHASAWQDFWDGLRKNWKAALLPAFLTSLMPLIVYWYAAFWLNTPEQVRISALPTAICGIVFLIWIVALPTVYALLTGYELKMKDVLKNAVMMTLAHGPTAVGVWLVGFLPLVLPALILIFASAPLGTLLLLVYGILLGFALRSLLASSFANRLCEEFINPRIGAPTRIGLRPTDNE